MIKNFFAKQKFKKKIKNGQFSFFVDILQLPHTVISKSEKLTHPTVQPPAEKSAKLIQQLSFVPP